MINVVKRDGEIAEFNLSKISDAITKAFLATNKSYTDEISTCLHCVLLPISRRR